MARTVDLGVTQYLWVPGVAGIANPFAPTKAELTAVGVKNISTQVVTTTDINTDASDTVNERSVTDVANVTTPTVGNYHGTLVMFRDYELGIPTEDDPLAIIGDAVGAVGWIVRRLGKPNAVVVDEDDLVSPFLFMIDNPQLTGGQGDGYLKATFPLLQQGSFAIEKAVVAA